MRKTILAFILGMLVSGGIVYAANLIDSSDVTYTPSDSESNVENVKDALDELYDSSNKSLVATRITNWIQSSSPSYTFTENHKAAIIKVYSSSSSYTTRYNNQVLTYTTSVTGGGIFVLEYVLIDVKQGDVVSCSLPGAGDGMSIIVID